MDFVWNNKKAESNLKKHGVAFGEAQTIFDDPLFVVLGDIDHSDAEDRFIAVGKSAAGRVLMVSYTERGDKIRIIGSRELTPRERKQYENG